ncbi:MAG TPA: CsiV family protein [Steroidobacteraceae bacterium]|nr:CsiV family protein [Steroidobacteraceae bacterium]
MTHTGPSRLRTSVLRRFGIALLAYVVGVVSPGAVHAQAAAQSPSVYTIEVIVFRNLSGAGGQEDWSAKSIARGPETPEAPVTGRFVQSLPGTQFQLNDIGTRLQNTANYQPVAHFAWQQTASSWGSRAGFTVAKLAGNVPGLTGTIYLERGSYLHLGMALSYQAPNPPAGLGAAPGTVFTMNESRRVKFFERNYYDHPAFGVIALVTPANRSTGGR